MLNINKASNGIATITLNRPEKSNAFDDELIMQMTKAFRNIDADPDVKLMVLTANGKHFSAGADLAWMQRMASYSFDDNLNDARGLAEMLQVLNTLSKPTIAKVQGAVFGGAVGLVSCCDMCVASRSASFCLSEVKIGLIPATISPYVIAAIGERASRRYFLSAERFSADVAFSIGLVSEICNPEQLDETLEVLSKHVLSNSPAAVTASKQLIADMTKKTIDTDLIEDSCHRIAAVRASAEGQEGLSAFLEKRTPQWLDKPTETS